MAHPRYDPALTQATDALTSWVSERIDLIAHAATHDIWHEVGAYRELEDATLRLEVEAHCRQIFSVFATTLRDRRDPARPDFPWTSAHASRRVDLGIALPDFMSAFRIGQITLWDDVLEGVRATPGSEGAALHIVSQLMRTVEVASTAAAESYIEARQYRMADSARVARDLLEDLLAGRPPVMASRRRALVEIGLDESASHVVVVGALDSPGQAIDLLRRYVVAARPGMMVARHDEIVAILPVEGGSSDQAVQTVREAVALLAAHDVFPSFGISAVHQGWGAIPRAFEEAHDALHALRGTAGVRCVDELSTLDFLVQSQGERAERLVRPAVRDFLLEDMATNGVFVETLRAYVAANLNAKEAALALHVHANTVYYRLDRIAERTGSDVRSVEDLIDLLLAVRLVRGE